MSTDDTADADKAPNPADSGDGACLEDVQPVGRVEAQLEGLTAAAEVQPAQLPREQRTAQVDTRAPGQLAAVQPAEAPVAPQAVNDTGAAPEPSPAEPSPAALAPVVQGRLGLVAEWRLGWRRTCHTMSQALGLRRLQDYIQARHAGYNNAVPCKQWEAIIKLCEGCQHLRNRTE